MSYHPNARPYKVICVLPNKESFIKKGFSNKDKAINFATSLSLKKKNWTIRVEKILNKDIGSL
tara:strand:- start:222 stop:410 length:189 start_codon:yes stop_codon:yes gene_type:complete